MLNYDLEKDKIIEKLDFLPDDKVARERFLEAVLKLLLFN